MSNILTAVRKALIVRLETITIENGYRTNIGLNVKTGWLNEVLDQKTIPAQFSLVQKAPNKQPSRGPEGLLNPVGFFLMGLVKSTGDDYEALLDDMEIDLLEAFMPSVGVLPRYFPKGVSGIEPGAAEQFPPGKGQSHAGVLIPIHIKTIIEGRSR